MLPGPAAASRGHAGDDGDETSKTFGTVGRGNVFKLLHPRPVWSVRVPCYKLEAVTEPDAKLDDDLT